MRERKFKWFGPAYHGEERKDIRRFMKKETRNSKNGETL